MPGTEAGGSGAAGADDHPADSHDAVRALVLQRRSSLSTLALLAIGPLLLVVPIASRFFDVSEYDEPAHIDYVLRIESGHVPRMGDKIRAPVVEAALCRGVFGQRAPDCGSRDLRAERIGALGYQYEAQQPPVYYALTGLLRQAARLGPSDDVVLTARVTGAAWLSAGLLVFWLALARLRVRPAAAATILLAALVSPGVLYQSATVTNDAAIFLLASLAVHYLLDSLGVVSTRRLLVWSALAALAVLTKPQILLAFLVMAVVAVIRRPRIGWSPVRNDLWVVPAGVAAMTYVLWGFLVELRAEVDPDAVLHALLAFKETDQLPLEAMFAQLIGLVSSYVGINPLVPPFVLGFATLALYVVVAADLRPVWAGAARMTAAGLAGWTSLVAAVLAGPAFTLLFFYQFGVGGGPRPRYGLVFLPGMLLGLVEVTRHRRALLLLQVVVAGLAASLAVLIVHPDLRTA